MYNTLKNVYDRYRDSFSGACLVKGRSNILFSAANGLANKDFAVPNNLETRFDTASVTKTFTAAAVLTLTEQGFLSLTDKIHDVIDLFGTAIPNDVTIEQLLNHTSGIADDADEETGEDYSAIRPKWQRRLVV